MSRLVAVLVAVAVLALAGCRGEAPPADQEGSVEQRFRDVESTLADLESELNGD